jgi:O-antigen/teichoic acid export membrane protein
MSQNFAKEDVVKVAKGAGVTLVGASVGKGLFLLSHIIIARLLGVEAFGLYALGYAAVKICDILARLGLDTGGMRFISIYQNEDAPRLKGTLLAATTLSVSTGMLLSALVYVSSALLAEKLFHKPELTSTLQQFSLAIPLVAGTMVTSALLQGFHTTKYTVYTRELVQPAVNILLIAIFYSLGLGLQGVIYAFIASHLAALIAGLWFLAKLFPPLLNKSVKPVYALQELLSYSMPLLFVGFLHFFLSWTDTLMTGFLGSTRDVGIYRAASQVPLAMTMFLAASNSIYGPVVADLYQKKEMQRLMNILKTTTRWLSYATVPLFLLLIFGAEDIMMLFGPEYAKSGTTVVILLAIRQLISCSTGGLGVTLAMTHKQKLELCNSLAMVTMNIVLNYLLIPRYGAIGAAISSCVSGTAINLIRVVEVELLYRINPFTYSLIKYLLPSLISVTTLCFLDVAQIQLQHLAMFAVKILIILVPFAGFFMIGKNLSEEDDFIYNKIANIFRKADAV